MSMIHWILGGLAFTVLALNVVLAVQAKRAARERAAQVARYGGFRCPNCEKPFGETVEWGYAAKVWAIDLEGQPFDPHVLIHCPHCRFSNCFDDVGRAQFGKGRYHDFFDISPEIRDLVWSDYARTMKCPRCRTRFQGWSGEYWGNIEGGHDEFGPVFRCERCGRSFDAVQTVDGFTIDETPQSF